MEKATKILSKSFDETINSNDSSWLILEIKQIFALEEVIPKPHKFAFSNDRNAAKINTKIIKKYEFDFVRACKKQKGSIVTPGSEFRSIQHFTSLFSHHEDWNELKSIIENGCDYKLSPKVNEETRKKDLKSMISQGNHKSTKKTGCKNILVKTFMKEVKK